MKAAIILVLTSIVTFSSQQNGYWPSPYFWNPYYTNNNGNNFRPNPYRNPYQAANPTPVGNQRSNLADILKSLIAMKKEEQVLRGNSEIPHIESSLIDGRSKFGGLVSNKQTDADDKAEDRAFGLGFLGLEALANYAINSVSLTTTSTTFTTTTSTLTIGTVVTCYTSSMFSATTACRRKRKLLPGLLIGDEAAPEEPFNLQPSQVLGIEPSLDGFDIIAREGKSFADDLQHIIESSQKEPIHDNSVGRFARASPRLFGYGAALGAEALENLEGTLFVSTSTVTSFSLFTSSTTKRVTNLIGAASLTCLPACFTLC